MRIKNYITIWYNFNWRNNVQGERKKETMTISKVKEEGKLTLTLAGRLDTTTAPQLEAVVQSELEGVTDLTIDFHKLDYISSAGLRVILATQKIMNKQGKLVIRGANETVMEVFEVTGFVDILTIE